MCDHSADLTHPTGEKGQPQHARPGIHNEPAFLAGDHRPPLTGVKLVRPRPRPDRALPLRALQHDPGHAAARNPAAAKKPSTIHPDDHTEVTGTGRHALIAKAPMGGRSEREQQCEGSIR